MAAKTGYLKQTDATWSECPSTVELPELCYGIEDDFLELPVGATTGRWTLSNSTVVPVLGSAETVGLGGVAVFSGSADDKYAFLKMTTTNTGAPFKVTKDSGKKLWFAMRVKNTVIDECCIYLGLFEQSVTQLAATSTGAENLGAAQDGIYWRCLLNATKGDWDICHALNGTEVEVSGDVLTSDTSWHTLGFTFDGVNTIHFYGDDTYYGHCHADDTNFPNDVGLTPSFGMILGEASAKSVYFDWIRCVQLR